MSAPINISITVERTDDATWPFVLRYPSGHEVPATERYLTERGILPINISITVERTDDATWPFVLRYPSGYEVPATERYLTERGILIPPEPEPPFEIGDKVKFDGERYAVIGVDGDRVWLRHARSGFRIVAKADGVERVAS